MNSIAIVGWSSFGQSLALALVSLGCNVLVINRDVTSVRRLTPEIACLQADSTDEAALREIEIVNHDVAVVAIDSDFERSITTTLVLKRVGVKQLICQASTHQHGVILRRVGAQRIIEPHSEEGRRLAFELADGSRRQEMDYGQDHMVVAATISAEGAGKPLTHLTRAPHGVVLLLYRENQVVLSPSKDEILQQGDIVIILTSREQAAA